MITLQTDVAVQIETWQLLYMLLNVTPEKPSLLLLCKVTPPRGAQYVYHLMDGFETEWAGIIMQL